MTKLIDNHGLASFMRQSQLIDYINRLNNDDVGILFEELCDMELIKTTGDRLSAEDLYSIKDSGIGQSTAIFLEKWQSIEVIDGPVISWIGRPSWALDLIGPDCSIVGWASEQVYVCCQKGSCQLWEVGEQSRWSEFSFESCERFLIFYACILYYSTLDVNRPKIGELIRAVLCKDPVLYNNPADDVPRLNP